MKEVAAYIGRNFSYGADIQRYLENEIKTGVSLTTRPTRNRDNVELSSNQNFILGDWMTKYAKKNKA